MGNSGESPTFDLGAPVLIKPIKREKTDNTKQKMEIHSIHPHWKEGQTDHWSPESVFNHLLSSQDINCSLVFDDSFQCPSWSVTTQYKQNQRGENREQKTMMGTLNKACL